MRAYAAETSDSTRYPAEWDEDDEWPTCAHCGAELFNLPHHYPAFERETGQVHFCPVAHRVIQ